MAELRLQEDVRYHKALATPDAYAKELEKVPHTAASIRELLDKAVTVEARLGRRELRNFKVCGGDNFCLPEYNLVGVAFWKAVGEALRDALVADGFDVKLRVYPYSRGDGPEPKPHPRTFSSYIDVEVDLRW